MTALKLEHEKRGPVDIIVLDGILNAETIKTFDKTLLPISDSALPYIIIEADKLTYISSAGIGSFIDVIKKIRSKEGDIRFCNMNQKVKRVFDLLDMGDFFFFYSDLESSLSSFENPH